MAFKTHTEIVEDEIVRQWDDRVTARAKLIGRAQGMDAVSDNKARELYWKRNPNPQAVLQAVMANPELTDWQITKLIYTSRADVLQAVKNEKGTKAMIDFDARMQAQGPPVVGAPQQQTAAPREESANVSGY